MVVRTVGRSHADEDSTITWLIITSASAISSSVEENESVCTIIVRPQRTPMSERGGRTRIYLLLKLLDNFKSGCSLYHIL